ncbi:MAG: AI-2E family transporter [Patescibacteria group bacterium]|jgi:predicted PurR-regulated permease PerM
MPKDLTKPFLLLLLLIVIIGCYLVFRPFLTEIFVAAILATVFYKPFEKFAHFLGGRRNLAALLMCLLLILIIIVPSIKLVIYASEKSVDAYSQTVEFFNNHDINDVFKTPFFQQGALKYLDLADFNFNDQNFKNILLSTFQQSSNWLISGGVVALRETTNFIVSLVLIILATFFFFVEGKKTLQWVMYLSPLPNKYDQEIFRKFRAVSYSTFVSTFVAAIAQGVVGAVGFAIVGFPAFLAGVLVALLSLVPYIGSMIFYVPVGIYYLLLGEIWQGIFILLWGAVVIGTTDNIIRAYMIKDDAEINPIFVLFSILGGIVLFGFWGVVLGPLVVALAVTVFHIYEIEFCKLLPGTPPAAENKSRLDKVIEDKLKKELK